ncbi:MAG TPA: hypothetical protein VFB12_02355 [Ktedonobacteraceae bacterium]|nr:hypothetical protein [Ktedonobacteraceae bacterium]
MSSQEFVRLWNQVHLLHQTVASLIELQRSWLMASSAAKELSAPHPETPLAALLTQLDELRDQLQPDAQVAEDRVRLLQTDEKNHFGEISVERVNVVEPDGRTSLVISNQAKMPDIILNGETFKRGGFGNQASILFYTEEGNECGGLVNWGKAGEHGFEGGGTLIFDQVVPGYETEKIGLLHEVKEGERAAGLFVNASPSLSLDQLREQLRALEQMAEGPEKIAARKVIESIGARRVFLGEGEDQAALLSLNDLQGKPRLRLAVDAQGAAHLEMFDADGQLVARFPAD